MLRRHTGSRVFGNEQLDARLKVGLIGHWLGGGSGLSWEDRTGYGNHAVFTGTSKWSLGGPRGDRAAVQFLASTDYLNGGSAALFDDMDGLSIAAWIYSASFSAGGTIAAKFTVGPEVGWSLYINTDGTVGWINFGTASSYTTVSVPIIPLNAWTHVAFARTASNTIGNLYLNGVVCTTTGDNIGDALPTNAAIDLTLGGSPADPTSLVGILDDVRLYNRRLEETEIALLASPTFYPVIAVARRTHGAVAAIDLAIWELTAHTTPSLEDLLVAVDDPAGTPVTKQLSLTNFLAALAISNVVVQTKTVGSGTYTPTTGMKHVLAIAVGGGGAGAGGVATDSAGGGGGGGGTCIRLMTATEIGASKAYVVGAAGAATTLDTAGALLNAGTGGAGTAGAQAGALGGIAAGGTGGTAANGTLNIPGARGRVGRTFSATDGMGGAGGSSVFGFGGAPGGTDVAGGNATGYGGGGGGGHAAGTSDRVGGAGSSGVLYLIEFL